MKNIIIVAALISLFINFGSAQSLNWNQEGINPGTQIYLNLGYDFGLTTQVGVAYRLKTSRPLLLMTDISVPSGSELNDFKFRLGAKMSVLQKKNFQAFVQYSGFLKRHETDFVRQLAFSHDLSVTTGIYKSRWSLALELGYEHTILNHLKHTDDIRQYYSEIQDGWFVNTAGYWHYGIEWSKKLGQKFELNLKIGATNARGGDEDALLPVYFQLGGVYALN